MQIPAHGDAAGPRDKTRHANQHSAIPKSRCELQTLSEPWVASITRLEATFQSSFGLAVACLLDGVLKLNGRLSDQRVRRASSGARSSGLSEHLVSCRRQSNRRRWQAIA